MFCAMLVANSALRAGKHGQALSRSAATPSPCLKPALAAAALLAAVLLVMLLVAWRRAVARSERGAVMEAQFSELVRAQSEMQGRMQTIAEVFGSRQSDLVKGLSERMDGLGHKLGQSMLDTTRHTHDNLTRLAERLAVIDKAQQNITTLSTPGGRTAEGALQQADPRRLRRGADAGDHPGRAAPGRLQVPGVACRTATGRTA